MNVNAKCFIRKNENIYEEITYEELQKRRKQIKSYNQKKFIYIHGMLLEVSEDEYKDYYKEIERNRYSNKILRKLNVISIEELIFDDSTKNKEIITDININIELEIEVKFMMDRLRRALKTLNNEEYKLITALYFENKSVREYAKISGINYGTIQYQKKQILKKLKKFFEF